MSDFNPGLSLRASSLFGGYREKGTRERDAQEARERRREARSRAARFALPNKRACWQIPFMLPFIFLVTTIFFYVHNWVHF